MLLYHGINDSDGRDEFSATDSPSPLQLNLSSSANPDLLDDFFLLSGASFVVASMGINQNQPAPDESLFLHYDAIILWRDAQLPEGLVPLLKAYYWDLGGKIILFPPLQAIDWPQDLQVEITFMILDGMIATFRFPG